jgi:hypothetical protein
MAPAISTKTAKRGRAWLVGKAVAAVMACFL